MLDKQLEAQESDSTAQRYVFVLWSTDIALHNQVNQCCGLRYCDDDVMADLRVPSAYVQGNHHCWPIVGACVVVESAPSDHQSAGLA